MSLTDLSGELAEEHDAPEPELFGFLAGLEVKGFDESGARKKVADVYGGSDE